MKNLKNKSASITENKISKSSPILVTRIANITPLTILLERIANNEYDQNRIKIVNSIQVKIQFKIFIKYILIIKELQVRSTDFHTYKTKEERSDRVVLKI